jgi:hypothetical protein
LAGKFKNKKVGNNHGNNRIMEQWNNRIMEQWNNGTIDQQINGLTDF